MRSFHEDSKAFSYKFAPHVLRCYAIQTSTEWRPSFSLAPPLSSGTSLPSDQGLSSSSRPGWKGPG